jgi:predicted nucleic acid-binding protein
MRALLDTNIVIHREATAVVNQEIGTLFKWLDKAKYEKCVHPISVEEIQKHGDEKRLNTLNVKLQSYSVLKTVAPLADKVQKVSTQIDVNENDINDTHLLNEIFQGRVDILISEDKKIHTKAAMLNIQDRVYRIDGFLEKVVSENPDLINYSVLSVTKRHFGNINLQESFFDSFRDDYNEFDRWFNKKADEVAYVTYNDDRILSFLYVKVEDKNENYADITPVFSPKRRLKIGTFKVVSNGIRLGERFLKIIFDNALQCKVDEIYVTIFNKTDDQRRLVDMLEEWGFLRHGVKKTNNGDEFVYTRNFAPNFSPGDPKKTYPYISADQQIFLCPIYPDYHTELFPDSILTTESPPDFCENQPHRNALSKAYISRSMNRNLASGDVIVFYRTGGYHKSVVTTIGVVESVVDGIQNEDEFILKCRKRSVFSDRELKEHWNYRPSSRPFIVNFLYVYSFPKRPNMARLIELGVIADVKSAPRGFEPISKKQFNQIIKESQSDESIIVN